MTEPLAAVAPGAPGAPARLSPFVRLVRVFARPADAWEGLAERGQWVFPLVLGTVLLGAVLFLTFENVSLPVMQERLAQGVERGELTSEQEAKLVAYYTDSLSGRLFLLVPQLLFSVAFQFLFALVVWFGAGFVLGSKLRYRHALDVICWSSLVRFPALILFFALAAMRGSIEGVHLGLGVLVPEAESPGKLLTGLTLFLDFIGPFEAWWAAVVILGTAALSGAPRRSVAWVLVALYLALGAFFAAVSAYFSPGA